MGYGRELNRQHQNDLFGKTPGFTPPTNIYVSLHTGSPGDDGQTANEASGGSYARKITAAADWNPATLASPSVLDNLNAVTFVTATANWSAGVNMTHFGLWRSLAGTTEADFLGWALLGTAKPVLNGDTPEFAAGDLNMDRT